MKRNDIHTLQVFSHVHSSTDKDTVLAEALSVVGETQPVIEFSAHRRSGDLVIVRVVFNAAEESEAVRVTQQVGLALSRRWPTDSVTLDRRPVRVYTLVN